MDVVRGSVSIRRTIRRKVFALLCFLSSRPGMVATGPRPSMPYGPTWTPTPAPTRSIRPSTPFGVSLSPTSAMVSTPGTSSSTATSSFSTRTSSTAPAASAGDSSAGHAMEYAGDRGAPPPLHGRYALDFAYEDWASSYRENLHAAVSAMVEAAMRVQARADSRSVDPIGPSLLTVDPAGGCGRARAPQDLQAKRTTRGRRRAVRALRRVRARGARPCDSRRSTTSRRQKSGV